VRERGGRDGPATEGDATMQPIYFVGGAAAAAMRSRETNQGYELRRVVGFETASIGAFPDSRFIEVLECGHRGKQYCGVDRRAYVEAQIVKGKRRRCQGCPKG
jgi:hypothetical protein